MRRRPRSPRGFTLIEMLTVVVIIGLVLTMLGYEFLSVVNSTFHSRGNTDAESQARIIMQKVETHMRTAYWDYVDAQNSPLPIQSPTPGSSASPLNFVVFYRVADGSMVGKVQTNAAGVPVPPFDLVTIQLNPLVPGELDEIITPQPNGPPQTPTVLGTHVTNFGVTYLDHDLYQVTLTVSVPSTHCVNGQCSFTVSDVVYVGGQQ